MVWQLIALDLNISKNESILSQNSVSGLHCLKRLVRKEKVNALVTACKDLFPHGHVLLWSCSRVPETNKGLLTLDLVYQVVGQKVEVYVNTSSLVVDSIFIRIRPATSVPEWLNDKLTRVLSRWTGWHSHDWINNSRHKRWYHGLLTNIVLLN